LEVVLFGGVCLYLNNLIRPSRKPIMNKGLYLFILLITAAGCRKPYNPPVLNNPTGYLVVEGVINSGVDSTFIKLSRTVSLLSKITTRPETGATVTVQGDQNTSYPLTETSKGNYSCAGLNLGNSHKYRLNIVTSSNRQYVSDYMAVLNSPPIDSISYDTKGTPSTPGLNVYVNTHDASGKVLYYRWDYQETWIIHANFASFFKSNGDTVLGRDILNDNITDCWQGDSSSTLVLGSSAKLSKDIIADFPVISIPSTSEKVGDEYSIQVRQYALTADAYNFYVNIKKNTEQLGSVFDALPSEIAGNIHSVANPSEPVIGYVSVGSTSSQRIFITNQQLPHWITTPFYPGCALAFPGSPCCYYVYPPGPKNQVDAYINYNKDGGYTNPLIPIDAIGRPGQPPIGYTAAARECVDCTLRGSNKKPAFWK
jgi:hypothetical protein